MKGVGRHRFLESLEKNIEENVGEWEAAKAAKSPTLQYEFLRKHMVKTLDETFLKNETRDSEEIIALRKERVRLLGERRQFMGATVCASKHSDVIKHHFHGWRVGVRLDRIQKALKKNKHRHHQHRLHQYYDELDYALDQNNSAEAWRLSRRICSALKGSRRNFIHFPRCNVTCQQFYDRYAQAPNMGG